MTSKWIKFLAVVLCGCIAFGFSGCDGNNSDSESSSDSNTEEEEKPIRVGYIFRGSASEDGFSGQINSQRINAASRCGGKVETYYIENVTVSDFEGAVKALYSAGCEVIVSCSATYTNMLSSISSKYMNIDFINYGSTGIGTANVTSYIETYYQGAYIAGTIAAYNSESEKIGIVADGNMLGVYPTVNAAALGIENVYQNAELCVAGATTADETEQAIDALVAEGCDVILCYTESPHSAEYCEKKGVKFIGGLDYSLKEEDYPHMLMYFYSKRDSFFLAKFKELQFDEWAPAPYAGTMANGIINVSEALPAAKTDTQKILDAVAPLVSSGQIYIFKGELKDTNGVIKFMKNEMMDQNQIFAMDWYVQGVRIIGNFRRPTTDIPENKFEIKS